MCVLLSHPTQRSEDGGGETIHTTSLLILPATAATFHHKVLLVFIMSTPAKALLSGTWKGRGHVLKATGEVVTHYLETATFEPTRKTPTFVVYRVHQDTQNADTGKPMHTETGFLKMMMNDGNNDAAATMGVTHPFPSGMVQEISTGIWNATERQLTLTAQKLSRLDTAGVDNNSNSKPVTGFKRVYTVVKDDALHYDQFMAAGGGEMYHHLHCEMEKVVD
eukprot:scaffold6301_cov165-Amphora_coffeaeformis.AAC.3